MYFYENALLGTIQHYPVKKQKYNKIVKTSYV